MNTQTLPLEHDPDYKAFCEERLQNPYPLFDRLRREDPVHWCAPMKLWLVTRYDDVHAGMRDPRFSSNRTGMYIQALPPELRARVQPLLDHVSKWIQLTDDPDHLRLRKLVNLAFTPKMITGLRPRIEELVEKLLSDIPPGTSFDLVEKFCGPLPAIVICEMLGIPQEEREEFRLATERVMRFSTRGGPALRDYAEDANASLGLLIDMFERLVAERRRSPREDLLSSLVAAEADGERLSNEELYAMCVFIFLAGHETTTNGLASGMLALLQNPDQFALFRKDIEGKVGGVVEETLRFESPVTRAVRRMKEDVEIGGKKIPAESLVVLLLGAANRDPARFDDPGRFDPARQPNRHLAFGFGLHFCLGALLARTEMEIGFRVIAQKFGNLRLVAETVRWKPIMGIRALEALSVSLG